MEHHKRRSCKCSFAKNGAASGKACISDVRRGDYGGRGDRTIHPTERHSGDGKGWTGLRIDHQTCVMRISYGSEFQPITLGSQGKLDKTRLTQIDEYMRGNDLCITPSWPITKRK